MSATHFPNLVYSAINDSRTRPAHAAMDGTILPVDHPWWDDHRPPNGFNCRCSSISLSEEEAKGFGGVTVIAPDAGPDKGWDYSPCKDGPEEGIQRATESRTGRCGQQYEAGIPVELALREPWWCGHPALREQMNRLLDEMDDWQDTEKLVRAILGDDAWNARVKLVRRASVEAGVDLPHGVILNAYTDRDLDIWKEALLLGRVIVHDASLRGWTDERILQAGLFLHLLNESVGQLRPETGTFYRLVDTRPRGFGQRFLEQHKTGNTIEFVVPTSVMRSREVLIEGGYVGDVMVELEAVSARNIQMFSAMNEPELLLPMGMQAIIERKKDSFIWMTESEPGSVPGNKKFGANHVR